MPEDNREIVSFVRMGLGCDCPEEVFSDIRIEPPPRGFDGLSVDLLVRIGGRLLVAVCTTAGQAVVMKKLHPLLLAGKGLRDRDGFNRFRLVIGAGEEETLPACLV